MEDWLCRTEGISDLSRQKLQQLQLEKLNKMLKKMSRIHKELPESIESLDQLRNLPFTTPQMLREHPERFLVCSQADVSRVISETSSGTTGGAKRVFYSETDVRNTIDFFASGISEMLSEGEKCLIGFPSTGPSSLGDSIAKAVEKLGAVPVQTEFGLSYGELSGIISQQKPQTYIGFPVPLLSLMRLYEGEFPIRRALISGDACPAAVWDSLKAELELYPHYGSRETALGGAVTCPAFEGMHLRENHIIAEIVDESGKPLPDGSWGELVITTIGLEAMPLLRYRTGDITRLLPDACPCGGITKRLDQVIRKQNGPVSIEKLDGRLFAIPELIDYSARYDGTIYIDAVCCAPCTAIEEKVGELYPDIKAVVTTRQVSPKDVPAYAGKRHIITEVRE